MKKTLLVLCCLSFLVVSIHAQESVTPRVDKVFEQFDKPSSPGCSLAVIKDNKIIYKRGYGMADLDHDIAIKSDTVFHVASVSKQFAAMSILLLAKEGKLSLDDEVRKYIPELRDFGPKVTIRHLLHHTSGLRDQWNLLIMAGWRLSEDVVRDEDILELVSRMKELNFKPGDQYMYSNTGFTLAGYIVKKVSGLSLREYTEANIFKPLGMNHTVFRDDHAIIVKNQAYGYNMGGGAFKLSVPNYDTVGASSLVTSVEDLALWDQNFYEKRVGGEAMIKLMQTPGVLNDGEKIDYALGLVVSKYRGLPIVEHSGADAGYRSHVMRFPEQRFSVACLCNYGGAIPNQYARRVADVYLEQELQPEPEKAKVAESKASEGDLKTLPGAYWNAWTEELARITAEDGKLRIAGQGVNGVLLPAGAANHYRIADQSFEIEFDAASEGARRMLIKPPAGRTAVFDGMPPAKSSPSDLAEYAGDYYSDEIDSTYKITIKDGNLTLSRKKSIVLTPQPVFRDAFSTMSILGTVRFTRDAQNRVDGFKLSAGRIRSFKFVKRK